MGLRVAIVGSRRRNSLADRQMVFDLVKNCADYDDQIVIVSGGCRTGADAFAEEAAKVHGLSTSIHPVPTEPPILDRKDYRDRAFARNEKVAADCDWLYALVAEDRKGGTENTIDWARMTGKKVVVIRPDGSALPT